jgi:hypothetical protein
MRALVDRIEGKCTTLLLGEDELITLTLPSAELPAGLNEGDLLRLSFEKDQTSQTRDLKQNAALRDKLLERSKNEPL